MVKLRAYQKQGLRKFDRFRGRVLVAWDMGTGKTVVLLAWAAKQPKARLPLVVICPASVKWQWQETAAKKFGLRAYVCEGREPDPDFDPKAWDVVAVNFEILRKWVPVLRKMRSKTAGIDECQALRNPSSKRTVNTRKLVRGRKHVFGLSGSPIENRPIELFPVLSMIRPDKYRRRLYFATKYCKPRKERGRWTYNGAKNLPLLHSRLRRNCMTRVKREDVLKDLPPLTVVPVLIDLPPGSAAMYRDAESAYVKWLRQGTDRSRRARQAEGFAKMTYLRKLVAKLKRHPVEKWVEDFLADTDAKLSLFYWHKLFGKHFQDRFGDSAVKVDGSVTGRKRHEAVQAFANRKDKRLFLGNLQAAGVGLDGLQKSCWFGAFGEYGWKPSDFTQPMARLSRFGQARGVTFYVLTTKDTIEERLSRLVVGKQRIVDQVLDGKPGADLDFYGMLEKDLLAKAR